MNRVESFRKVYLKFINVGFYNVRQLSMIWRSVKIWSQQDST